MALSRDDRLLESIQEFKIFGGADHMLDRKIKRLRENKIEQTK